MRTLSFISLVLVPSLLLASWPWLISSEERALRDLNSRLDALVPDSLQVQWCLQELEGGEFLSERASGVHVAPGSLIKLLTTAHALDKLGPGYRFTTKFAWDSLSVVDRDSLTVLSGDLHVIAGGDPTLSHIDLLELCYKLWQRGIDRLDGDLVIHANRYGQRRLGPGWMWDDGSRPWAARISAATINQNCLLALPGSGGDWLLPGAALLSVEEMPSIERVYPRLRRDWRKGRDHFMFYPVAHSAEPKSPKAQWIPGNAGSCNVEYPDSLFRSHLFEAAQSVFGAVNLPRICQESFVQDSHEYVIHESAPLVQVLDSVLTKSWNLAADQIFLETGLDDNQQTGWSGARDHAEAGLASSFIKSDWFRQVDGSGMSRYNAITPLQVCDLLRNVERGQSGLLRELLPAPGEGTLQGTSTLLPSGVWLKAKTGTLTGTHALAGYLSAWNGRRLVFALVVSGHAEGSSARRVRDQWLQVAGEWLGAQQRSGANSSLSEKD